MNIPASRPGVGSCSLRTADGTPRYAGIFYGLGNFGTDQPGIPLQVGLIGHVNLAPGIGVFGMQWDAVASVPGEERQQLVPLDELLDDEEYAAESTRLDQHVGASFRRR